MKIASSLALLRADARLELSVLVEHRARNGEDPAIFLQELPTPDELVVATILDDELHARGLAAEFALARLAGVASLPDADRHQHNADQLELQLLREIAEEHPELTRAVWTMVGRIGV